MFGRIKDPIIMILRRNKINFLRIRGIIIEGIREIIIKNLNPKTMLQKNLQIFVKKLCTKRTFKVLGV